MGNYRAWQAAGDSMRDIGMTLMNSGLDERRAKRLQQAEREAEELAYRRSMRRKEVSGEMPTRTREEVGPDGKRYKVQEERQFNEDFSQGRWAETARTPILVKEETRELKRDGNIITQRLNPQSGAYEDIATSPQWSPSRRATGGAAKAGKPSWATVRDPDDPRKWRYMDQNSGRYATDADGNLAEAAPPYRERRGSQSNSGRIADAVESGVASLASSARQFARNQGAQAEKPAAAEKSPYPEGTRLQGPDGKMYVVRNGVPVLE